MTFEEINKLFREKGLSLGACESFTGGLYAAKTTEVPGASHFFKGSIVSYTNETKARVVGISYNLIDRVGVVSQEVCGEMASHAMAILNVDYAISFSGNAGPEAMEDKPVGEVYIGVASHEVCKVIKLQLSGSRDEIRNQALQIGNELLAAIVLVKN